MTNVASVFSFENQRIDIIFVNGEPHFIGKQVCGILGYVNSRDAIARHVDEEDKRIVDLNRGANHDGNAGAVSGGWIKNEVTIINESGLYSLILSSKLPTAKKFKHWVTSEVLPSIRKTGKYEEPETDEMFLARAVIVANEKINALKNKVAALLPKATAYDAVMETFDSVSYRDFCNKIRDTLGVNENEVRDYLVEQRLIYKVSDFDGKSRYKPYKETIDRGMMIVKDTPCNDGKLRPCNYFTYKGQQMLIDHFAPTVELDNPV